MPAVFPKILSDRVTAKYPITRANRLRTKVFPFVDQSEQRWAEGVPLMDLQFTYHGLSPADKDTIRTFYIERQGQLDTTWTIVFSGVTYIDCFFVTAPFEAVQTGSLLWDVTVHFNGRPEL